MHDWLEQVAEPREPAPRFPKYLFNSPGQAHVALSAGYLSTQTLGKRVRAGSMALLNLHLDNASTGVESWMDATAAFLGSGGVKTWHSLVMPSVGRYGHTSYARLQYNLTGCSGEC